MRINNDKIFRIFISTTFLKFIIIGVINTAFGYGIIFLIYNYLMLNYWISTSLGNFIAIIISFILNSKYTFKSDAIKKVTFVKFIFSAIVCYILAYSSSKIIVMNIFDILEKYTNHLLIDNVSIAIGIIMYSLLNYIAQFYFVFNADREEKVDGP